jgi:uncharacterized repeat protein (TIGR01451 family)
MALGAFALLALVAGSASAAPVLVFNTLSDSPDPVLAGNQLTISVTVANNGTVAGDDATNVIVRHLFGSEPITYSSETFSGSCSVLASPSRLECNLGSLAHAATKSGNIVFNVAASAADGSTIALDWDLYSAEIAAPGTDGDTSTTVDTAAEIVVNKIAPSPTNEAVPGTNLVYTATIQNQGPSDAQNVVFTDPSPTGLPAVAFTGDCSGASCSFATVAAGTTKNVTMTFAMPANYHLLGNPSSVTNVATATSDTADTSPPTSVYSDSVITPVVPKSDLHVVSFTDGAASATPGNAITYTFVVQNQGPSTVGAISLTGTLPGLLSPVFTPTVGIFSASAQPGNWSGVTLATSASATLTVNGWVNPALSGVSLVASVSVAPGTGETDGDASDDSATDTDSVSRVGDLSITKSNGLNGVVPNQAVPYTIVASNSGPSDVAGASVTDTFDALRISGVSWTCSGSRPLTGLQQLIDGAGGVDGLAGATALAVTSDGKHVYVTGLNDNAVAVFSRNLSTGVLTFVEVKRDGVGGVDGLDGAAGVAISPDGAHVYVTGANDDAVATFSRNSGTGALTYVGVLKDGVGGVDGLDGAGGVAVAPDGRHVYVGGNVDNAVAVFSRNSGTGVLTFVEVKKDGVGGVDGLAGARGVAISPDGRNVLVAGQTDNAVANFTRNSSTGALTFLEMKKDAVGGVDGLGGASGIAVAPAGGHVYVTGSTDDAIAVFSRDATTGALSWLQNKVDGNLDGSVVIDGLDGARGISVSPDGKFVFAAGLNDGKIAIFRRTSPGGTLQFAEATAFASAVSVAMTPAGDHLLATGFSANALGVFSETDGATCTASGSGNLSQSVTLPAHASVTFLATATVASSATGVLTNTATVTAPGGVTDATTAHPPGECLVSDTTNNQCTDSDQIGLEADLEVTKTTTALTAVPGQSIAYVVIIENHGPAGVNGISVSDTAITGTDFASDSWTCSPISGGVCGANSGSGSIVQNINLPAGASVRYDIVGNLKPDAVGTVCGPASCVVNSASATLPPAYIDPTPADLSDSVSTQIGRVAELVITKTVASSGVGPGDPLDFVVTAKNCGPSDVTGAVVQDVFPGTYLGPTVGDTTPNWTCVGSGGTCPASGDGDISASVDLDAGDPSTCVGAGTVTFTIHGRVDPGAEGVLTNVAKILEPSSVLDPTPGNNTASARVILTAAADLAIVKDDGRTTAVPGEPLVYTITVFNNGPDNVELAHVVDVFPAAYQNAAWVCSSEAPALGTLTFVEEQRQAVASVDGLTGARAVVVSPDGKHVYGAGYGDAAHLPSPIASALVSFTREAATGKLTYFGTLFDGQTQGALTVDGLDGVTALAMSADGKNVYASSETDNAVSVFKRNPVSGALTYVEVEKDGVGGVNGLAGASSVAVSPDGKHVYVSGATDNAVAVFSRDAALDGAITFVEFLQDNQVQGPNTIDPLTAPSDVAVSPDGAHVYVSTAGGGGDLASIVTFARGTNAAVPATFGRLTFVEALADGDVQGLLTIDQIAGAAGLTLSPDGHYLYLSATVDDAVSVFRRNSDPGAGPDYGKLSYTGNRHQGDSGSGGSAVGIDGAVDVAVSPDGQHLYVTGLASHALTTFQRNTSTGGLKFLNSIADGTSAPCAPAGLPCTVISLGSARSVTLSPDGEHVYTAASADNAISVFERAAAPPSFAFIGGQPLSDPPAPVRDGVGGVDGLDGASAVAITSDGLFLYATGFADASIVAFQRDSVTGELTFINRWVDGVGGVDGLDGASAIAISGNNVYVVSQSTTAGDNTLVVFTRNPGDGQLSFLEIEREGTGGVSGLFGASGVAVSPDGKHVYVASRFPGAVAVFSRDNITGAVTFLEKKQNGIGGVIGMQGARGLAISSDGAHVYVAADVDDSVVVFARGTNAGIPATFGRLTELQVVQDADVLTPVGGATLVQGLDQATGIAVSPDPGDGTSSRNVYVGSHTDNALVVLQRNVDNSSPSFGRLSGEQLLKDGVGVVDGLAGARSVAVSPDGKNVYVAAEDDDAFTIFARESVGGTLVFVEARKDGVGGVDGLDQAYGVAVTPNGRHIYVAGFGDDAIAAFSRSSGSRCTGSGVGNIDDLVDVAAGGQVAYTVTGTVDPAATGTLVNQATVAVPSEVADPGPDSDGLQPAGTCLDNPPSSTNDLCRDIDTLTPKSDLNVVKTDHTDVAIPGEELTYTLTVRNDGASNVVGATVTDDLSLIFPGGATWVCVAAPSGTLSFGSTYFDGETLPGPVTLDGLDGATSVALTPDGVHAYVTGLGDDAVVVFRLDDATGLLTFVQKVRDGVGGIDGLDGSTAAVVSPDGAHVYVVSQVDDTISVFTRDANPLSADYGKLTALQVVQDAANVALVPGATLVTGIDQPLSVAVSTDGENLYVAAANSNAVSVFARGNDALVPASYGKLTFIERQQDGVAGVDGLAGASGVAVAPDGLHVYATGANDNAVAVFARDGGTGALSYLERQADGEGANDGLAGARGVVVSPDNANVYVAGAADGGIAVFERSLPAGTLTFRQAAIDGVGGFDGLAGATQLTVSSDGFHVYATGAAENAVAALRREAEDSGRLSFVQVQRDNFGPIDGLDGASGVALTANGRWLFVTGRVDDAVTVFSRPVDTTCASGSGTLLSDTVNIAAGSKIVYTITGVVAPDACPPPYPCTGTGLVNTASVTLPGGTTDPDPGDNSNTDTDNLSARVNLSITKTDGISAVSGLLGASFVVASPAGEQVYAGGEVGDGVLTFERDSGTGALHYLGAQRDGVDGVDGINGAAAGAFSPDGAHLYVAGSADNAVAAFARDGATGVLTFLERYENGNAGVTGILGARGVATSPDGKHVYVASPGSSAVAIFSRDAVPADADYGKLTFVAALLDGQIQGLNTIDGLAGARAVTVAPNGAHVYVAGETDDAIAVFSRDSGTGLLTYLAKMTNGVGGVSGLASPRALSFAPAGDFLYVAAAASSSVAVFKREVNSGSPNYGKLTFVEAKTDGAAGVDGLATASGVAVVPDPPGADPGGQHVYVAGRGDNAVAVFSRNDVTGALTYVGMAKDGVGGVIDLGGATGVAVSPDGLHVLAAAATGNAVVVLDRDWNSGLLTGTGALSFLESHPEGSGTIAPGTQVTYLIDVINHGPGTVQGATVTDIFPGELESVSWTCTIVTPPATCFGGSGDLTQQVNLGVDAHIRYTASGTVKAGVSGTLVNTATVAAPNGVIETDLSDNSATDDDTVLAPIADVAIVKRACTDPLDCAGTPATEAVPGTPVYYEFEVTNAGPSDTQGIPVTDILPEALLGAAWTCTATPVPGLLTVFDEVADGDALASPVARPCLLPPYFSVDGLDGASAVTLSDDGLNLYVASATESAVAVFRRDLRDGSLAFVQAVKDGDPVRNPSCTITGSVDGLGGAIAVVASPDGNNVYVAGETDDAVAVFDRDPATGALSFRQIIRDGVAGANGLGNVRGLAISPDGKYLYTAARSDNAVGIFARNSSTGALTFVALKLDGSAEGALTVDGLAGAAAVALSPDGTTLYAAGEVDDGVAAFKRNAATGLLTFVDSEHDGSAGVDGLNGATALVVAPDGKNVYVAGAVDDAVAVFSRNTDSLGVDFGKLTFVEMQKNGVGPVLGIAGADAVAMPPDGEQLYVAGGASQAVAIFERDPATGALTWVAREQDGVGGFDELGGARGLVASVDGDQIYVAAAVDDAVSTLARHDGSRCPTAGFGSIEATVKLVAGGDVLFRVSSELAQAATGTLVNQATAGPGADAVDPNLPNTSSVSLPIVPHVDLTVTKTDGQTEAIPGLPITYTITISNAGPSDLVGGAVSDDLPAILLSPAWTCQPSQALSFVEMERNGVGGVTGLDGPYSVAVAPDPDGIGPAVGGAHVYVASPNSNSVAVFARNAGTGALTFLTSYADGVAGLDGLGGAKGVALSPDGKNVYVAAATDESLEVFSRDAGTGLLTSLEIQRESDPAVDGLEGASGVVVSPDGAHVYAIGETDDAVVAFRRDPANGKLTFVQRLKDGFGGLPLQVIDGPVGLAITPDGRQVVVAGSVWDSLAVFDRDAASGALTYRQVLHDGVGGVDGLDLARAVVVSPGGRFLYVASLADDAVAIFSRNVLTGVVAYVGLVRDGVGGVDGLDGARGLALTPDGQFLYVVGYNDDAVAVFRRDGLTGLLTQVGIARDGVGGVDGLDGPFGLAVDPQGKGLYVVGNNDDAVAAFLKAGAARCAPSGSGDITDTVDIAVGGSVTYTVTATVDPGATGTLVNTVDVGMPSGTTNTGDTSATDSDTLVPTADLTIAKTDNSATALAGGSTIYQIVVTNVGPSHAPASIVADPFPTGVTAFTWSCLPSAGAACPLGGTGPINALVDLQAGSSATFTVVAQIDPTASGTLANTATISPAVGVTDPSLGNNTSTDTDTLIRSTDLAIDKTVDDSTVEINDPIQFTITVTNLGPSAGGGATVTDLLPAGLVVNSATGTGWLCTPSPGVITCTTASLPLGAAPPIVIDANAPSTAGNYVNGAGVASADPDPVAANDSDTVGFHVGVSVPPQVLKIDSTPSTPDSEVTSMETLPAKPTALEVRFDEAMNDPGGDSDPHDVTNPAGYRVIGAGPDGVFSGSGCAAAGGDDITATVTGIVYTSSPSLATLTLSAPLADGLWRLVACAGVLQDTDALALDGDGDGTGGDDFTRFFRVQTINMLAHPQFDFDADLTSWVLSSVTPGEISRDTLDGVGFSLSGAVELTNLGGGTQLSLRQCQLADPGLFYFTRGRTRIDAAALANVSTGAVLRFYGSVDCSTAPLLTINSPTVNGDTAAQFRYFEGYAVAPAIGAVAIEATYRAQAPGADAFDVWFDGLELFPAIFADGFEVGSTVRWSATSP